MPKVSVVVPTYNRADLLPYTLDSVLAQTHPEIEVIVMDNASTDATAEVMAGYQSRDSRIRYIRHQTNVGMVANYNLGLQHATGEFVDFLDSDDLFEPAKIEKQVRFLLAHPEVDAVYTRYYNIDFDGRRLNQAWILPEGDLMPTLMLRFFAVFGTLLMRAPFARKMGVYDPVIRMAPDWDFYLRAVLGGARLGCMQEVLFSYRLHPNNITRNALAEEEGLLLALDRALAHPSFPSHLRASETRARTSISLWLAYGCCVSGHWDDMQRHLRAVWTLNPSLCDDPAPLLPDLREMALSVRVPDPLRFLDRLLANWPGDLALSSAHRARLRSEVHLGFAFRLYAHAQIDEAQRQVKAALSINPALINDLITVDRLMMDQAVGAVMDSPVRYMEQVFNSLPPEAQSLQKHRHRFMGNIQAVCAFASNQTHRRRQTQAHVLAALLNRPQLVTNRGMLSIFAQSLLP